MWVILPLPLVLVKNLEILTCISWELETVLILQRSRTNEREETDMINDDDDDDDNYRLTSRWTDLNREN